jgi:hypothetical protein
MKKLFLCTLILPLIGLPVAIGLFYLYQDLKKIKTWKIERDPSAQPNDNALESGVYVDLSGVDRETIEAIGAGIEAGVESVVEAAEAVEAGVEVMGKGIGGLLETAGHLAGYLLHH